MIVDQTKLEGFFDVEFSYAEPRQATTDPGTITPDDVPEFFTAVREQLGFKLVPSKTTVEILVVDHVERPTEN